MDTPKQSNERFRGMEPKEAAGQYLDETDGWFLAVRGMMEDVFPNLPQQQRDDVLKEAVQDFLTRKSSTSPDSPDSDLGTEDTKAAIKNTLG